MKNKLFILLLFCLCSCSGPTGEMKKIYEHKEEVLRLFHAKRVIRSRGQNTIYFETYSNHRINRYIFNLVDGKFQFLKDSIQYPSFYYNVSANGKMELRLSNLTDSVSHLVKIMDELNIRDIDGAYFWEDVIMKLSIKHARGVMLHVADTAVITQAGLSDYINSMEKIDDQWYFSRRLK